MTRTGKRSGWRVAVTTLVGVSLALGAHAVLAGSTETDALGPGLVTVDVGIEHSRFDIADLVVREGTTVEFVVRNGDPIAHELIVGGEDVHERHAEGTEEAHPPVPGEVSVGPGETGVTAYTFDRPGTVVFACHLPRHFDHGMHGRVEVVPT